MKILGVGHCPVDETHRARDLPSGELVKPGPPLLRAGGGSVANALCLLGRLGHECVFLGNCGDDEEGDFVEAEMLRHGVTPKLVHKPGRRTPRNVITLDKAGERTITPDWGRAPADYSMADFAVAGVDPKSFDYVVTEFFTGAGPKILAASQTPRYRIKPGGKPTIPVFMGQSLHNPTPARAWCAQRMLLSAELSFVSFEFWEELNSQPERKRCPWPVRLPAQGYGIVYETLGPDGVIIHNLGMGGDAEVPVPAKVKVVDTTGAGDAFAGAMLHLLGIPDGEEYEVLDEAVCIAAQRVAGLCCRHLGARGYLSDMDKVRKALGK